MKAPVDLRFVGIPCRLPGSDFLTQHGDMRNTAIQTLLGEHREFTFGHIEPTAMLRRIVKFQLPRDPACFGWCKGLIQRGGCVGIEVIHDQANHVCLWKMHVDQLLHLHGEVMLGAACRDLDVPPTTQGLNEEKEMCRAFAAIFIIVSSGVSRPGWQGVPRFTEQLHGTFIKTDLRTPHIIRLSIQIQHILHVPDEVRTYAGNAPVFTLPRLEIVFFRTQRTVSSETASTRWVPQDGQPAMASSSVSVPWAVCYKRALLKRLPV